MNMLNQLSQTLLTLLEIDSVYGNEEKIGLKIQEILSPLTKFQCYQEHYSLYYTTEISPEKKTIALYGHTDTVHNQQDRPPYVENEKIYGCGASDMKGGLSTMIELMKKAQTLDELPYNLVFVFYEKEEGSYAENGLGPLLDRYSQLSNCDLAFALEPTDNVIQVGCVGGLHAKVEFRGKSAHSARPWHGENALHKGGKLLSKLDALEPQEVSFQGLKYYEVLNATLAQAGKSRNTIPNSFELNLNYRFAPGKSVEDAKRELLDFIGDEAQVTIIDESPSGEVILGNSLLDHFLKMHQLEVEPKQAWTDIARLGLYGIPAVNFGSGSTSQAHQKNEWILIEELQKGYQYFDQFLFSSPLG